MRSWFAPVLVVVATALTVVGTFLPFFRTEQAVGLEPSGIARTTLRAWRIDFTFPGQGELSSPSAPLGVPLLLAAAILLAASVFGVVTRRPARRTTLVGAAFLAGAVCTVAVQGMRSLVDDRGPQVSTTPLAGTWVLLAAVATAAAAAVIQSATRRWADPEAAYADTPTPPSGVVITVLPPEED
ncbi:hypothetical protein AB0J40_35570 [Amycolatopsis sp. NPDC049691]|uniref:hypothetical protein n=1 Tax=Amycolatopsis sp. NPDC049691 TaxID=3155155 RepID=UPI003411FAF3